MYNDLKNQEYLKYNAGFIIILKIVRKVASVDLKK